jgi:hypothetical protein
MLIAAPSFFFLKKKKITDYSSLQEEHTGFIPFFLSFYYFTKKDNEDRKNSVSSK